MGIVQKDFWYDIRDTLSYNALLNMVIGNRGCGKTFSTKQFVIDKFLKKGEQFIYLRRFGTELDDILPTFFEALAREGKCDYEYKIKGETIYINGKIAGYGKALAKQDNKRGLELPNVKYIVFDEFLIVNGVYHYLPNEVEKLLNFYSTVNRLRDNNDAVILILLGNNISFTNPYYMYFGFKEMKNTNIQRSCDGEALLHIIENSAYTEKLKQTRLAKLTKNTEFFDNSIANECREDNKVFIERKSDKAVNVFNFIYKGKIYGVWFSMIEGKYWVSTKYNQTVPRLYAITKADHSPNTLFLASNFRRKEGAWARFIEGYKLGCVFFEDYNCKSVTYEVIRLAL